MLVDSLVVQQRAGLVRKDDAQILTSFIWSIHGIAWLVIDGPLGGVDAVDRICVAIGAA